MQQAAELRCLLQHLSSMQLSLVPTANVPWHLQLDSYQCRQQRLPPPCAPSLPRASARSPPIDLSPPSAPPLPPPQPQFEPPLSQLLIETPLHRPLLLIEPSLQCVLALNWPRLPSLPLPRPQLLMHCAPLPRLPSEPRQPSLPLPPPRLLMPCAPLPRRPSEPPQPFLLLLPRPRLLMPCAPLPRLPIEPGQPFLLPQPRPPLPFELPRSSSLSLHRPQLLIELHLPFEPPPLCPPPLPLQLLFLRQLLLLPTHLPLCIQNSRQLTQQCYQVHLSEAVALQG